MSLLDEVREALVKSGTSAGAKLGWDKRGRGRKTYPQKLSPLKGYDPVEHDRLKQVARNLPQGEEGYMAAQAAEAYADRFGVSDKAQQRRRHQQRWGGKQPDDPEESKHSHGIPGTWHGRQVGGTPEGAGYGAPVSIRSLNDELKRIETGDYDSEEEKFLEADDAQAIRDAIPLVRAGKYDEAMRRISTLASRNRIGRILGL